MDKSSVVLLFGLFFLIACSLVTASRKFMSHRLPGQDMQSPFNRQESLF